MVNGAGLAGGGAPQQAPPQQIQASPGNVQGGDQQLILQALEQAISQAVDEQGYVDVRKLAQIWPQVAQQLGLNIPFEAVLQMIKQNPEIIEELVQKLGLAGIVVDGRQIGAEELAGQGAGASAGLPGGQVQTGGV